MADFNLGAYDFTSMGVPSMPVLPEQNWLGKMKDISPEAMLILASQMGAGIGGPGSVGEAIGGPAAAFGQSSLANKAMKEQKKERQDWRSLVASMISGETPVNAAGTPGISGLTLKPGKDGGTNELSFSVTEPTDAKKKKDLSMDLGDIMSSPF